MTAAKNSSSPSVYTGYTIIYDGVTYKSAVKMESATTITFTTYASSKVTVGLALKDTKNYGAAKATVKLDGTTSSSAISEATTGAKTEAGVDVTFNNVAAGEHTISRGDDELGVFYIKVEPTATITATYNGINFAGSTLYTYGTGAISITLDTSGTGPLTITSSDTENTLSTLSSTPVADGGTLTLTPTGAEGTETLTVTGDGGASTTVNVVYKSGVASYPKSWVFDNAWTNYSSEIAGGSAHWTLNGNHYYNTAAYAAPGSNMLVGATGTQAVTQTYGLRFTGAANRIWTQSVSGGTSYLAVGADGTITIPGVPAGYTVGLEVYKTSGTPTMKLQSSSAKNNLSLMYNDGANNINNYSITGTQANPQLIYVTAVEAGDIVLKVSGNFVYFNSISVANVNALDRVKKGNTYEVYSPGVLNTQTVSSIPGITMDFGSSAQNQYVRTISGQDGYYAYCVTDNGYTHTTTVANNIPSTGTFYKFTLAAEGTLSVTGVATVFVESDKSNVVLVKSDGTTDGRTTAYDDCSTTKTTLTFSDLEAGTYYLYGQGATTWNLQSFTFTPNNKFKTIMVSDMKYSPKVNSAGLNANAGLNRTLGGFSFEFTGGEGIKYNNGSNLLIRVEGTNTGKITITPQNSAGTGTITITKVVLTTNASRTGSVKANDGSAVNIDKVSSCTFDGLNGSTFTLEGVSGEVFIEGFTIYYTEADGATLSTAKVTPTITWSKSVDDVTTTDGYTSPTIETSPKNFDISIASSNTGVAAVAPNNWTSGSGIVSLTGTNGTATVTASSTANDFYNAATDATYTVAMTAGGTGKKWDFTTLGSANIAGDTGWNGVSGWTDSGEYYGNKQLTTANFSATNEYANYNATFTQMQDLKLARYDNGGLKAGCIRLYNTYLTYNNTNVIIGVPVSAGQSVIVTFSDGTYTFDNATVDGDESAASITAGSTTSTVTLIATADGYVNLVNSNKAKLYSIEVKDEARQTLTMRDNGSNTYSKNVGTDSSNDNHFSHRVTFSPDGALTSAKADKLRITSSDNTVLDVSGAYVNTGSNFTTNSFYFDNIIPVGAGTATLTITFDGDDSYKPYTYESHVYTVSGVIASFRVAADDQQIQRGQRSVIIPVITDKDGNALGIKRMEDNSGRYTTYVLDEDEDQPDYTQYFNFTFTQAATGTGTNWDQIVVAESTGEVTTENNDGTVTAEPGATRDVTITATPKDAYATAFATSATATTSITLTIIQKQSEAQVDFYWDAERTDAHKITVDNAGTSGKEWAIIDTEAKQDNSKLWNFKATGTKYAGGFPNGKMLYVKAKMEGDSIWFSYKKDGTAATIPANPKLDAKNGVYEYRRGIPIYIDEELTSESYVTVNVVATSWDAATQSRKLNGSVVRMRFDLTSHGRPPIPTYEPVSPDAVASNNYNESSAKFENSNGGKMMNTSQNVVAYDENSSSTNPKGGAGNLVFGKFSTSSKYTTEQLINEKTVTVRQWNVPVVSTEVAKRRFTTVQIRKVASDGDYGYSEYVSPQTHTEYWYLYDTELTLTPNTNFYINTKEKQAAPAYKVTWYNKKTAKQQEVDSYEGKMLFEISANNGAAGTTINATTGEVTAGTNAGWVMVTVTYAGGETHGGKTGEPQYVSTTDKSTATYYVYISDPSQEEPVITPPTRNFTQTQHYRIQAPENWDVRYTIDGTDPTVSSDPDIAHGGFVDLSTTETITVKAIAYNPNSPEDVSRVVSETYTKVTPLPDPVFDPDGVATPYRYNTSTLTVQIACAYPGSIIYYTVDGSDPVRGASNTYQYSGLSKVVISGNVAIKAIAYDASRDIYSNVVRSSYIYSDVMSNPFFQISNDGGMTWYGFPQVGEALTQNGTEWYDGQSWTVTPTTQIRIIDPNPVAGTIYYTLDGKTMPSDDVTSMVYVEGYPFTVNKTTLGQAITVLEDASSDVSTANFLIDSASGIDVWEAVAETTPDGKMKRTDGFVISTDEDLSVANTGSKVNWNSLSSSLTEHGTAPKTYAQKYITATFGGFDLQDWSDMTIADRSIGAPIDGVGKFSLKSKDNAKMEAKYKKTPTETDNYNHVNSWEPETIHERTFRVPAKGTYVQFEPERDGDLTIWVLQQGAVHYEEDEYFIDRYIRVKPVYLVDEQGKSYKVKEVNGVPQLWSAARLTENWTKLQATQAADKWSDYTREGGTKGDYIYLRYSDGAVFDALPSGYTEEANLASEKAEYLKDPTKLFKKMENKGPNKAESRVIYNLFDDYITKNHISVGDPIKPFAIHSGAALSLNNGQYVDNSNDGTGYVLASGGYAKYTFELKAGKTYYFMGVNTKIGIRGFQFIPTETDDAVSARKSITIHASETTDANTVLTPSGEMSLESAVANYGDKPVNVTLDRTFKANTWTTLLLPFSVSVAQIEKVFGAQTDIILFDDVINDDREIHMIRHWHKMIVAGTPVIIMPRQNVADPVFQGVHLEAKEVDEISSTNGHYKMTGTFVKAENALNKYDYYINTSGNFTWLSIDHASVKGSFSWLKVTPSNPNPSRMLSVAFSDFSDNEDEGMATGIINVEMPDGLNSTNAAKTGAVYNLKGQKVGDNSLESLPKGIYIVNGKKVVVE